MLKKRTDGFTIIEVLVVLAIAGLIMFTMFLAVPHLKQQQKKTQARNGVNTIVTAAGVAQQYFGKPLRLITGNGCSNCACRPPALMTDAACVNNWKTAVDNISLAGLDISDLITDPWGNPYSLDENEGEVGLPPCTLDSIRSVGPDGIQATSDDFTRLIPLRFPC
jgi:prepilin-type N-terminal cleavage/methylation domain-containing protein